MYRILTAQGPAAKGGSKNYPVDGQLKEGAALVAYPAEYRVSGVMTFIINENGVVYQKGRTENPPVHTFGGAGRRRTYISGPAKGCKPLCLFAPPPPTAPLSS